LWEAVKRAIQQNTNFILCTHRDPDADGIGSELALYTALVQMGKRAVILNPDSLPPILQFMDPEGLIRGFDSMSLEDSRRLLEEAEVIFFLDSGVWNRLQPMTEEVAARAGKLLCIDHHPADKLLTEGSGPTILLTLSARSTRFRPAFFSGNWATTKSRSVSGARPKR